MTAMFSLGLIELPKNVQVLKIRTSYGQIGGDSPG